VGISHIDLRLNKGGSKYINLTVYSVQKSPYLKNGGELKLAARREIVFLRPEIGRRPSDIRGTVGPP